jgi:hydrogenase-4 component B
LSLTNSSSKISGPIIAGVIVVATVIVWLVVRFGVYRRQKVAIAATWDCGTPLNGRMEITATGFARSIVQIFRGILRPTLQHKVEYEDAASRYMPVSRLVTLDISDVYQKYLYRPTYNTLARLSVALKHVQNGNLNAYILYIFVILLVTLVLGV